MTDIQLCTAKIRPFSDNREVSCYLYDHGTNTRHIGYVTNYISPKYSTELHWAENDRRNFRGEWAHCEINACIFPKKHPGAHAV